MVLSLKQLNVSESMEFVCVNLFGGLGNQLFQYAAAKTVALKYGCQLCVNKEADNAHNIHGHNYAQELFTDAQEVDWPKGSIAQWLYTSQGVTVVSQDNGFAPWDLTSIKIPTLLNGYFQYYPALLDTLPSIVRQLKEVGPHYPSQAATFLHIRRGDYVEKSEFHYLQSSDYYLKAIDRLNPTKILVFSDDIEWCKEQEWLSSNSLVEFIDEPDEICALFRMASCYEGAILANSTFSWWAAVLSETPNVAYPSRWIAQEVHSLFPPSWICIT